MREKQRLLYDIYDPSSSVSGGYWQLGTANKAINKEEWQKFSGYINQGLPVREDALFRCKSPELEHELWGCLHWQGLYWVYRHFLTGHDNFNRPGRYFFVLFKLESPAELRNPATSNILRHLAGQTAIPLDVQPLKSQSISTAAGSMTDRLFPNTPPSVSGQNVATIAEMISKVPANEHHAWVISQGKVLREYPDLDTPPMKETSPPPVIENKNSIKPKSPVNETSQKKQVETADWPSSRDVNTIPNQWQRPTSKASSSYISYTAGLILIGLIGYYIGYTRNPHPTSKYLVEVVYGTGTGSYAAGTPVKISSNLSRDKFIGWEGDTEFLDKSDRQECQINRMPDKNIRIKAKYSIFWLSYDKDKKNVKLESLGDTPNNIVWEVEKRTIDSGTSNLQYTLKGGEKEISATYTYKNSGGNSVTETISIVLETDSWFSK